MNEERVYIGLGTNLGDRWHNILRAVEALRDVVTVERVSPVYETAPWGYEDQPPFFNAVIEGRTDKEPLELLDELKHLEQKLGRRPSFRYGPRLIDLDLLLYGSRVMEHPRLVLPHPTIPERAFVLVPLADLIPDFIHPVLKRRIVDLLADVDTSTVWPAVR